MAIHYFALQIGDDQMFRPHILVRNATRFDDHQTFLPRDATGIAKGVQDKASSYQFEIGFQYLFAQTLQHSSVSLLSSGAVK
jgi:hypothetical protein